MADNDDTTKTGATQSGAGSNTDPANDGSNDGAGAVSDATLQSRYAGQTAKVGELTGKVTAAEARALAAEQKLTDYEAGKVSADEALKSQLAARDIELAAERRERALERIEAKYPETFAVMGEDAAGLTSEKLAEMEARLAGNEPPTPGKHSENKNGSGDTTQKKAKSADDVQAELEAMSLPAGWGSN